MPIVIDRTAPYGVFIYNFTQFEVMALAAAWLRQPVMDLAVTRKN